MELRIAHVKKKRKKKMRNNQNAKQGGNEP
jgi:hypothetical protein